MCIEHGAIDFVMKMFSFLFLELCLVVPYNACAIVCLFLVV